MVKNKFIYGLASLLICCGPNRDFEDKNIFGSQTVGIVVASSSTGDVPPPWSQDNVGYDVSENLPAWLSWNGYPEGIADGSKLTTLPIESWFDPDGGRGIHAILFLTSKYDCDACKKESKELQSRIKAWNAAKKGIKVVVLVINSPTNGFPDAASALQWKSQYALMDASVVVDGSVTFSISSSFATPLRTIVDPRTMKVFEVGEGYTGDYITLEGLADGNK